MIERLFVVVSFLAMSTCAPPVGEDRSPTVTVRDSADIEIVENHASVPDSEFWTVDPEPVFVLGGYRGASAAVDDVAHLVWEVGGAARLSDGRVAVLSKGEALVLIFETSGALAASFGGRGRGPGEFSEPEHLQVLSGDTIAVWDYMFGRVSYFNASGALLRERSIDLGAVFAATRTDDRRPPETVHLPLRDGSFLVKAGDSNWQPPAEGKLYRRPIQFVRIDQEYNAHSFGGWWADTELLFVRPLIPPVLPFRTESWAAAGTGSLSVYVSPGDRYEVHQFSAVGVLRRIIRHPAVEPIPIMPAEVEAWKARVSARQRVDWRGWDRAMDGNTTRAHRPAVAGLLTDADDNLWVANRLDPDGSEWSVFDPNGRWQGTLGVPLQRITWLGRDLILGVKRDPDTDVETVVGYRLNRPSG